MGNSTALLEKWLKEQIGPKNLLNKIKKEFPNWLEIAPQLPTLLHSYLNNHNKNSYTILESNMRKSIKEMKIRQDRILIAIVLIFIAITLMSFSLIQ